MNMLHRLRCLVVLLALAAPSSDAAELPVLPVPDWQPFAAQVRRVSEALTLAGSMPAIRLGLVMEYPVIARVLCRRI